MFETLPSFLQPVLLFFANDPVVLSMQLGVVFGVLILIFLVFYTTKDILLRTHSFWYTIISILLVALLPVVGFLFYLLIRPTRTLREVELEQMIRETYSKQTNFAKTPVSDEESSEKKKK